MKDACTLLAFFHVFFFIVPNTVSTNVEDGTQEILDFLAEGEKQIKVSPSKDITLVLGLTGTGKTTLTTFFTGNDGSLVAHQEKKPKGSGEYIIIDTANKVCNSTIESCTILPELYVDNATNSFFYDCPGFSDTRSVKHDISVMYFIKKILKPADAVKLLFAVSYPSVQKGVDRYSFMSLVKNILAMVKDVEKFSDSIALVVTKVDMHFVLDEEGTPSMVSDELIIEKTVHFLEYVKADIASKLDGTRSSKENIFNQNAIKLVDIFTKKTRNQYSRIGLFRRPSKAGPLRNSPLLKKNKKRMNEIINGLEFTRKQDDDFGHPVAAESKNVIRDLLDAIEKKICAEMEVISGRVKTLFLNRERMLTTIEDQCLLYQTGSKNLAPLKNVKDLKEPGDLVSKLTEIFVASGLKDEMDNEVQNIVRYGNFFTFLQTQGISSVTSHPLEWIKGMVECSDYVEGSKVWYELLSQLRTSSLEYAVIEKVQTNPGITRDLGKHISGHISLLNNKNGSLQLKGSLNNLLSSLGQFIKQVSPDNVEQKLKNVEDASKLAPLDSHKLSFLKELSDFETSISCPPQNKVVVEGRFVKLSDLLKQTTCALNWKEAEILGHEKVFFDRSLIAKGSEAQISIMAPVWEVIGRTTIDLEGSPGEDVLPSKAEVGFHGRPGGAGGRGGCFLGLGESCVNCTYLEINTSGGKGGRGQDGGNGFNGADFDKGYKGESDGQTTPYGLNGVMDCYDMILEGQPGGRGADGGVGGPGGPPGPISVIFSEGGERPGERALPGQEGSAGDGGSGGVGGSSKRIIKYKHFGLFGLLYLRETENETILPNADNGPSGSRGASRYGLQNPKAPLKLQTPLATLGKYISSLQIDRRRLKSTVSPSTESVIQQYTLKQTIEVINRTVTELTHTVTKPVRA